MFADHRMNMVMQNAIANLDPHIKREIEATFRDYNSLSKIAERDREVVLGVLSTVGVRLDEVHPHPDCPPETSRTRVMKALENYAEGRILDAGGVLTIGG